MKRIIAITAAALMTSALAGSAYAGSDMKKDDSTQMNHSGAMDSGSITDSGTSSGVDAGTTASTGQPTMEDFKSAMNGNAAAVSSIKSMSDVSGINVVFTSELSSGGDATAADETIQGNQPQIDDLQAAIDANDTLKSKLEAQDIDVSSIVAAQTDADGSLTVYVNDKS